MFNGIELSFPGKLQKRKTKDLTLKKQHQQQDFNKRIPISQCEHTHKEPKSERSDMKETEVT